MRACRYLGVSFTEALGIAWSPMVEQWALMAETAEAQAQQALAQQDAPRARHG